MHCKDRSKVSSENLETLYLLGDLKEPVVIDSDETQKLLKKTDRLFVMLCTNKYSTLFELRYSFQELRISVCNGECGGR